VGAVAVKPIDPADEGMHEPTDHPQFNESMYYNFVDSGSGFAVLIRMGNRVNEGYAEVTVLVYLPDGGAAIKFQRAPITENTKFDSGGLRFDVIEPLKHVRVTFDGEANRLEKGTDLADPKRAFSTSPVIPLSLRLDYDNIRLHGMGESDDGGLAGGALQIATGHYQGPQNVSGTISLDGETFEVNGLGFRDHSWGPRIWQGPKWWRWISCLADENNGFVGWLTKVGDEVQPGTGMVLRDGELELVNDVEITSTYSTDKPHYPETIDITLSTPSGKHRATGTVFANVPLRHRRDGTVARLAEVIAEYEFDGLKGYGIMEYHDLMDDDVPAGLNEA
jgi:hypothetical protein